MKYPLILIIALLLVSLAPLRAAEVEQPWMKPAAVPSSTAGRPNIGFVATMVRSSSTPACREQISQPSRCVAGALTNSY